MHRTRRASLTITVERGAWSESELRSLLTSGGISIKTFGVMLHSAPEPVQTFECDVHWSPAKRGAESPEVLREIERRPGLISLNWKPVELRPLNHLE